MMRKFEHLASVPKHYNTRHLRIISFGMTGKHFLWVDKMLLKCRSNAFAISTVKGQNELTNIYKTLMEVKGYILGTCFWVTFLFTLIKSGL